MKKFLTAFAFTSWFANAFLLISGAVMAISPKIAATWQIFGAFAIGHILWLGMGIFKKDKGLAFLNINLLLLDFYAIFVRF